MKSYRVKTPEEMLLVPGVIQEEDNIVGPYNTFTPTMRGVCGKIITSATEICDDQQATYRIEGHLYFFTYWMVEEVTKPINFTKLYDKLST